MRSRLQDRDSEEAFDSLRPVSQESSSETAIPDCDGGDESLSGAVASESVVRESSSPEQGETTSADIVPESSEEAEIPAEESPVAQNPYLADYALNADMAAWIQVPGTVIDYPVMWTPRDENYYLNRGFDGKENKNGCLILDTDSCVNPLTTNLIIHGHNMKSGAMFGSLTKYADSSYGSEHKTIYLYTPDCKREYEVIAVFYSQVYRKTDQVFKYYKFFQADTEEQFTDFYDNIKALSLYDTGVTASFGDHFITLSTCSYHVEQGRFVVVAKETKITDIYLPAAE